MGKELVQVTSGTPPPDKQQRLQIGQGVVQPLAAGAAVEINGVAAIFKGGLYRQHGVRIVLLHRHPQDVFRVLRLLHGVKITQHQIRHDVK